MRNLIISCLVFFGSLTQVVLSYSESQVLFRRPTVIIGFHSSIKNDSSAGDWFTRALERELQKVQGVRTPSADSVVESMKKLCVSPEGAFEMSNAVRLAEDLGCVQFITGELEETPDGKKIKVSISLYDAQLRELLVEDAVTVNAGGSGIGIYDALDGMKGQIVKALFDSSTFSARLGLGISTGTALAYVNGKYYGEIQTDGFRWIRLRPNREHKVEYRDFVTRETLLSTNMIFGPDTQRRYVYVPRTRFVMSGFPGARITKPDGAFLNVPTNGMFSMPVEAETPNAMTIETRSKKIRFDFNLSENTSFIVRSSNVLDPRALDYNKCQPLFGLLLPGFPQFQANDPVLGAFDSMLAAGGIGLAVFGFVANSQMDIKAQNSVTADEKQKFTTYGELYRTIGAVGIGVWGLSAVFSACYAWWHPGRFKDPSRPDQPLAFEFGPGGMYVSCYFN